MITMCFLSTICFAFSLHIKNPLSFSPSEQLAWVISASIIGWNFRPADLYYFGIIWSFTTWLRLLTFFPRSFSKIFTVLLFFKLFLASGLSLYSEVPPLFILWFWSCSVSIDFPVSLRRTRCFATQPSIIFGQYFDYSYADWGSILHVSQIHLHFWADIFKLSSSTFSEFSE